MTPLPSIARLHARDLARGIYWISATGRDRVPTTDEGCEISAPRPSAARTPKRALRGRRVLVVDDNEDAASLLAELLESMGNTTRIAHDGPTALHVVEEFSPEIAVLDIGLPIMDGYELARRLRIHVHDERLKLVALTGYGRDSDRQRAVEARFDAHLVKPIAFERLQAVLRDLL